MLLVTAAQSGGRLVPFAPASVGAGAAMLAATFGAGHRDVAVPVGELAAFFVGTSVVLTMVGTALTLAISCYRALARAGGRAAAPGAGGLQRQLRLGREATGSAGGGFLDASWTTVVGRPHAHAARKPSRAADPVASLPSRS